MNYQPSIISLPDKSELPTVSLYMDQMLELLNHYTSGYTKSMINNYVKNHVIKPPVKKRYNLENICDLLIIDRLKSVFSLTEITAIMDSLKMTPSDDYYALFQKIEQRIKKEPLHEQTLEQLLYISIQHNMLRQRILPMLIAKKNEHDNNDDKERNNHKEE